MRNTLPLRLTERKFNTKKSIPYRLIRVNQGGVALRTPALIFYYLYRYDKRRREKFFAAAQSFLFIYNK